jgi:UDP-N-acetylmuramate: L-alanyl-gamma-D-glutamyl-meso-diaminopimelate ligase
VAIISTLLLNSKFKIFVSENFLILTVKKFNKFQMKRIHFISIGGAAMHSLAIALHKKGYTITGSDDEIFEPSKSRLDKYGLLPKSMGWFPDHISVEIDAVILGMHARIDNPELIKAQELGIRIFSYPEYLYEQTKDKIRVVVAGSHGKTTITSIIMHILKSAQIPFDYMVGSQLEGFETMVNLSNDSKIAVFEGDEYLSSPIDRRPKIHLYKPNLAILSGIDWDHINVFPTFENYLEQFKIFIDMIEPGGTLVYCADEPFVLELIKNASANLKLIPYSIHPFEIRNGIAYLKYHEHEVPLEIFGEHNLKNIQGAKLICNELGITDEQFYLSISSFKGAAKRLQLLMKNECTNVYLDFAHSPSKLRATTNALSLQFPDRKLVACMELHTFSSLTEKFLSNYAGAMDTVDFPIVYFSPEVVKHKKLAELSPEIINKTFANERIKVFIDKDELEKELLSLSWKDKNLLLMSSGNFSGMNFNEFAEKIIDLSND